MKSKKQNIKVSQPFTLSEDWLSVGLAFLLILLSVLGVLGEHGISIQF